MYLPPFSLFASCSLTTIDDDDDDDDDDASDSALVLLSTLGVSSRWMDSEVLVWMLEAPCHRTGGRLWRRFVAFVGCRSRFLRRFTSSERRTTPDQ